MIDFSNERPAAEGMYTVTTLQAGDVNAWPVSANEAEGIGTAVLALVELMEHEDFNMSLAKLAEGKWLVRAETMKTGYPAPQPADAYVLPVGKGAKA